jgi:hypothetical protein
MTAGVSLGYMREGTTTGGGSGLSDSYELKSLTESRSRSRFAQLKLTPSQPCATTSIQGNSRNISNVASKNCIKASQEESASIASHDSRQIMIKQEWKVSEGRSF